MKTLLIELLVMTVLFTCIVVALCRGNDPVSYIFNYPKPIMERCVELGLIEETVRPARVMVKKFIAMLVIMGLFGVLLSKVNGYTTFLQGFFTALLFWAWIAVWDVVIDVVWFCRDPYFIIPGTEDLTDSYHDYLFHVMSSVHGLIYGIPGAVVTGLVVMLLAL